MFLRSKIRNNLATSSGCVAAICSFLVLTSQPNIAMAEELKLSDEHSMVMQAPAAHIAIAASELKNIEEFFHSAEMAIESERIDELMSLYSERYTNLRNGDKQFAREIWIKIFSNFDDISSRHSMQLISYDEISGQAITECSGLLSGTTADSAGPVTIDRWDTQRHILIKEGYWKLFGNAGTSARRYGGEGEEMHPLF